MFTISASRLSVRFVAFITVVSLIMSAFPASFFVANAQEAETAPTTDTLTDINTGTGDPLPPEGEEVEEPGLFKQAFSALTEIIDPEPKKVIICKATASQQNPYNQQSVNENSLAGGHGQNGINENDIVPPTDPYYPNGHNWNSYTESIYENGCNIPKPKRCETNLLANGSFEEPTVTAGDKWQKFAAVAPWNITKVADATPTTLELMRGWNGNVAPHGEQYAELDGDHSTKIAQTVATLPGATYELSWAFAARHGISAEQNHLRVSVDGADTINGPLAGTSPLGAGDWQYGTKTFVADDETAVIEFMDIGPSNSFGTFIDDAQLCLTKEPPKPKAPEVCSLTGKIVDATINPVKFDSAPVDPTRRSLTALDTVASYSTFGFKDGNSFNNADFFTLGVNGYVTYEFTDKVVVDQAGPDIAIWEITGGNKNQLSTAKATVAVSQDGVTYVAAGSITGDGLIDISSTGLSYVKFVKVTDNSASIGNDDGGDGYDVDAITIIEGSCSDTITVVAEKIVCKDEASLPNWGAGGPNITSTTAADFVAANPSCMLVPDWQFEWSKGHVANPGDTFTGVAGGTWNTFGPTDGAGLTSVTLPYSTLGNGKMSFREVLKAGYIPFTYAEKKNNSNNVTAEFYCSTDVLNYDNLEYLTVKADSTTHCVAWNVADPKPVLCEMTVKSDTTNRVVERDASAVEAWTHGSWIKTLPMAKWIWADEYAKEPRLGEQYTFENKFGWNPAATVTGVTLKIAADNLYKTTLNGDVIADEITPNNINQFGALDTYVLATTSIDAGNNIISSLVKNVAWNTDNAKANPGGLYYELVITGEGAENCGVPYEEEPEMYTIDGYKFNDRNGDGDWDKPEEESLSGWTIELRSGETLVDTEVTDEDGYYSFTVLAGSYQVSEVQQSNWEQTATLGEADGNICYFNFGEEVWLKKVLDEVYENPYEGQCVFGNQYTEPEVPRFDITGYKWNDLDGDGEWDENESGLEGWTIRATNGETVLEDVTDENGMYSFSVTSGAWEISEVAQSGWTQTGLREFGESISEALTCEFLVGLEYEAYESEGENDRWVKKPTYSCDFGNQQNEVIVTPENPTDRGSRSSGTRTNRPQGQVLGATTQCGLWLEDYMQKATENDSYQVLKLQVFLNLQGFATPLTGIFGTTTEANVKLFQAKYFDEIIKPWFERGIVPHNRPTGFVYKTTRWKINDIMCPGIEPYPSFEGENLQTNVLLSR